MHKWIKLLERQSCYHQLCAFVARQSQTNENWNQMRLIQPAEVEFSSKKKIFHQNWSDLGSSRSSEFRGLLAVSMSVQAFIDSLEAQTVVWYTDNQIVVCIANIGSKVPALQKTAFHIHRCCLIRAISADQYYFVFLHVFMTTVLWKHGPEALEMHHWGVRLLHSVTLRSCIYLFFNIGQTSLRCTLGGFACCIQLQLKIVDFCFPVRAKDPWDAPLVCLLVVFS